MEKIFVTRAIPEIGLSALREKGYDLTISEKDGVLTKDELIAALKEKEYDAVLCLLTDTIDASVFDAAPKAKIFSNYAVGFNNIDIEEAKRRGVVITNTPGVLTDTVAEHTAGLIIAIVQRLCEADRYMRAGRYVGWAPMLLLGMDLKGKTLGILGAGRIGARVAEIMHRGFDMRIVYYDVQKNDAIEQSVQAEYRASVDDVVKEADVISIHVPLLDSTTHLINADRLRTMKNTAYLVNTSRGPVIDETALVEVLKNNVIKGAALDVFENEPMIAAGLQELENVVLTPHIASATEETRGKMAHIAAENIVAVLEGREPLHKVE